MIHVNNILAIRYCAVYRIAGNFREVLIFIIFMVDHPRKLILSSRAHAVRAWLNDRQVRWCVTARFVGL